MKKEEYFDLKSKFCAIEEKIYLFDSGEHDEYDYDSLCDELDRVHEELCFAVSKLSQKLYDLIYNYGNKIRNLNSFKLEKRRLTNLLDYAFDCKDFAYNYKYFNLNRDYGIGLIDGIGADFKIDLYNNGAKYYGYREYLNCLDELDLIE